MKKKRLNVIDWLIILGVFFILASVVLKFFVKDAVYSNYHEVRYIKVEISGWERNRLDAFSEGDEAFCYDGETTVTLGNVTAEATVNPHMKAIYNSQSGSYISTEDTKKCDVELVFEANGYDSESGFLLGGTYTVVPGMTLDIQSGGYEGEALIIGISDKK